MQSNLVILNVRVCKKIVRHIRRFNIPKLAYKTLNQLLWCIDYVEKLAPVEKISQEGINLLKTKQRAACCNFFFCELPPRRSTTRNVSLKVYKRLQILQYAKHPLPHNLGMQQEPTDNAHPSISRRPVGLPADKPNS